MIVLLLIAVCFLAYTNGANDSIKGVASLLEAGRHPFVRQLAGPRSRPLPAP